MEWLWAHETAHSIGGLGDEYERYTNKPNMSDTTDPEKIKWSKMLGFRGIGITNAGTDTAFAPKPRMYDAVARTAILRGLQDGIGKKAE